MFSSLRSLFRATPLLLLPVGIYAFFAFTRPAEAFNALLDRDFIAVMLPSGANGALSFGHALTLLALVLLLAEMAKSTRASGSALIENSLAVISFAIALVLFLVHPLFNQPEFALITVMLLADCLLGFGAMTAAGRAHAPHRG